MRSTHLVAKRTTPGRCVADVTKARPQANVRVILFKRPKQPYFKMKDREMGWGRRSLSEIKICTVNVAVHDEVLREPAVRVMAEQLKDTMSHIENGYSFHGSVLEGQSVTM